MVSKSPARGLGCMRMSQIYATTDETESLATIDRARRPSSPRGPDTQQA